MLHFPAPGARGRIGASSSRGRSRAAIRDRIATISNKGRLGVDRMRPTVDDIRRAAYDRWERRGWAHGGDRDDWSAAEKELTFQGNYRTIAEFGLEGPRRIVLGDLAIRRCRFCERTSSQTEFGAPRPVITGRASPLTAEVCRDCESDWWDGLDEEFRHFWARLGRESLPDPGGPDLRGRPLLSIAAFKALVAGALAIMPGSELPLFIDTLEWVSNPDHESDDRLLDRAECLVYRAPFLGAGARVSLARRVDDDAPVPYMLHFLECDGIMVQVPLPMCLCDEDLDGREIESLERVPASGSGPEFREARSVRLPLSLAGRRAGRGHRASSILT
jgi:hypothetical protein